MDALPSGSRGEVRPRPKWLTLAVAVWLGVISGLLVRLILRALFEGGTGFSEEAMLANLFFATVPFLGLFLAWLRRTPLRLGLILVGLGALLALVVNLYPFIPGYQTIATGMLDVVRSQTGPLTAMHLPVVLWLLVGVAYTARTGWRSSESRLGFIRFTGELLVYLVLTWLLGGAIFAIVFAAINIAGVQVWTGDGLMVTVAMAIPLWLFLSVWMTEQTRSLGSRLLSVLTWVFTPLMILALLVIFGVFISHGTFASANRDLLLLLDFVLLMVLALVLAAVASRNPARAPGPVDWLQFGMIALAAVMNLFALIWMFVRLAEFGWTANRAAALGLNLLLMVNLVWTGWLLLKFFRTAKVVELAADENYTDADYFYGDEIVEAPLAAVSSTSNEFQAIIDWQTKFLVVYLAWAAFVVLVFPLIFAVNW